MKSSDSIIQLLIILLIFFGCSTTTNNQQSQKDNQSKDSAIKITKAIDSIIAHPLDSEKQKSEDIIGKTVNSIDDLLDLIYPPDKPAIVEETDTVNMSIAEIIGNDTIKIVYLNGESDLPSFGHILYLQSVVFIKKNNQGWEIMDADLNQTTFDYSSVEFIGIFGGRMLTRYMTSASYAGGVTFSSSDYTWHDANSLEGVYISFIKERSNVMSDQCLSNPEKTCECYSSEGKEGFYYHKKWNCLIFNYKYENTVMECDQKNPQTEVVNQKWFMNSEGILLAKGYELSEYGEHKLEKVNLSEKEIMDALKIEK